MYNPSYVDSIGALPDVRPMDPAAGVVAGVFELNDYNYEKPSANLLAHKSTPSPPDKSLVYDYPGGYDDKGLGERLTKIKLDAQRTLAAAAQRGAATRFGSPLGSVSQRTSPSGDSRTASTSSGVPTPTATRATGQGKARPARHTPATMNSAEQDHRMPLRRRRPVIVGTQPAKVVGKDGEEIDVDEQGRVLVEFYWDAGRGTNKTDKTRSRRVRVGQPWAGKDRGALFIPRIWRRGDGRLRRRRPRSPNHRRLGLQRRQSGLAGFAG